MNIKISENIKNVCPELQLGIIRATVSNSETSDELWSKLLEESEKIRNTYKIEEINKIPEILSTRQAYKKLGKDPNRYRPSAEALCRRIVRDIPIYRLNTLVDIINIVSISSGYSIGAFDAEKIQGDLFLDVGKSDELFEAIGRGLLNIEGLPVFRDKLGGIGTPTSDCERTKITMETKKILIIINDYYGLPELGNVIDYCLNLLRDFALAENLEEYII
jgi:DNA/RNA-binding domain of Phe-tRNA-synthetase-like protein